MTENALFILEINTASRPRLAGNNMTDQNLSDSFYRSNDIEDSFMTPNSPARPMEPYDAFYVSLGDREELMTRPAYTDNATVSLSEPCSPFTTTPRLNAAIAATSPQHQHTEPSRSAPSSPNLAWSASDAHHGNLSDGEFLNNKIFSGNIGLGILGPILRENSQRTQTSAIGLVSGDRLEQQVSLLEFLSEGDSVGSSGPSQEPLSATSKPLPPLKGVEKYEAIKLQDPSSDEESENQKINHSGESQQLPLTPVLKPDTGHSATISPILEPRQFEGHLSDGEFLNSRGYHIFHRS